MRIVFYTHPFFLEPALEFTRAMATRAEFHLMIELTPRSLGTLLATTPSGLTTGVIDGRELLARYLPGPVADSWEAARSVRFVVYGNARSVSPATVVRSRAALRAIDAVAADVIHLDDGSLRLALAAPWLPSIDLLNVHDPLPHSGDANRRIAVARTIVHRKVRRFRLHNATQVEPFVAQTGVDRARVVAIPLGAYDLLRSFLADVPRPEPRTVLFTGRLAPYKGLDALYAAAPAIAAQVPGVRFIVAGRPIDGYTPPPPPDLPRGGRIDVRLGHVANRDLAALYATATVVACPYRDATQSGVVLSAFAFDTPVVATSVGGLPEYVRDGTTGLLVPREDVAALADAITRVLVEPGLRAHLSSGIAEARRHDLAWSSIAERVLAAYAGG